MKTMRKILMVAMTIVMMLGLSVSVYAADAIATVTKITAPKSITVYTNDDATKELTAKFVCTGSVDLANFEVVPKDRGIVNVSAIAKKTDNGANYVTVKLNPIKNGTTTVTIYNKNNKKVKATTTVKVKTYADGITFGSNSSVKDDKITVVANGKINLNAKVSNNASNKTLTYKMTTPFPGVSVDKSGNITTSKSASGAKAVVTITSADKKASKQVDIEVVDNTAKGKITFIKESTSKKLKLGKLNKNNAVALKSNASSSYKTYQLVSTNASIPVSDLVFTSSKPDVATVNAKGQITAVKAGKATIKVKSKTGVKVSASVAVTVTTDVEVLRVTASKNTILANGKDAAKLTVATNSSAGNKKIKYTVKYNGVSKTKNASVDKKGNFKAKKSGNYTVTAYVGEVENTVSITAIAPTTKVTISGEGIKKGNHNIVINNEADFDTVRYSLAASANGEVGEYTWTSSNEKVATVENKVDGTCVVTPVSSGKAKITVKNNGKSASVNVTVKVAAYSVFTDKAVKDMEAQEAVVYVTAADNAKTTINLASAIAAYTNKNATDKTVKYYNDSNRAITTVKLAAGDRVNVTAKSNSGATCPVVVKALAKDSVAQKFGMEFNDEDAVNNDVEMFVAEKRDASATVFKAADDEGIVAANLSAITYKSNNTKVVTVDKKGMLTAKKAGVATVTATFKNPYDSKDVYSVATKVYVGSKDSTIKAALNSAFASVLKEENRDWTGIKATFSSKSETFTFNVLDFEKDVATLENTGLNNSAVQAGLALLSKNINILEINVKDADGEVVSTISRAEVLENGLYESLKTIITEAIGDNTILEAWVGSQYTIEVVTSDNVQVDKAKLNHTISYKAVVKASDTVQKNYANVDIAAAIDAVKDSLPAGISNIEYNASTRTATVYANDPEMTFEEAKDSREALANSIAEAFENVALVDFAINVNGDSYTDDLEDVDGDKSTDAINSILDRYTEKLSSIGAETYKDADGSVATAIVTFKMGQQTFKRDYTIAFAIDRDALVEKAEEVFENYKDEVEAALEGAATVESVEDGVAVIAINKPNTGVIDGLNHSAIDSVIRDMLDEGYVDKDATATVVFGGKLQTLSKSDYSAMIVSSLLAKFKIAILGDLEGKTAYVKMPVSVGNTHVTVAYEIRFVKVEDDSVSQDPLGAIAEEVEEAEDADITEEALEAEEIVEETVVDTEDATVEEVEATEEVEDYADVVEAEEVENVVDTETAEEAEADVEAETDAEVEAE